MHRIYFFFSLSNHHYDDMSLSSVLHRFISLISIVKDDRTDYVNMKSIYMYFFNARRPKAF